MNKKLFKYLNANIRYKLENKDIVFQEIYDRINNDKDLYLGYQANIAVSFIDAYHNYKKNYNKKYLNHKDIHKIANNATINFLNLWTHS